MQTKINKNYVDLKPSPSSLIESLRDIGYSLETAIADIIDNSITAKANEINIRFSWNQGSPWIAIIDNGLGMSLDELTDAMRFGSKNPLFHRDSDDLGRYGLGMKTASLSQCRHLRVISKQKRNISCCEWDLDMLLEDSDGIWKLGIVNIDELFNNKSIESIYQQYMSHIESGTIIWWDNFDRFDENWIKSGEKFFDTQIYGSRKHIELVFHRFLSPEPGQRKLVIKMNEDQLEGFNPFNPNNLATQELQEQQITISGERIILQPYILPHHNKVTQQEYDKFAGEGGYSNNQGFYVYRNRRLIIYGTWFRLLKKDDLNKLIRIRVDIPNSLDSLWKIDVKKSHANPPEKIRSEFKKVILKIQESGRRVYAQRGRRLKSKVDMPVWSRRVAGGKIIYELNKEYPLLNDLMESLNDNYRDILKLFIATIESTFPSDMFFNDYANNPANIDRQTITEDELSKLADKFISIWIQSGIKDDEIPNKLLSVDPFAIYEEETNNILSKKGYNHE